MSETFLVLKKRQNPLFDFFPFTTNIYDPVLAKLWMSPDPF